MKKMLRSLKKRKTDRARSPLCYTIIRKVGFNVDGALYVDEISLFVARSAGGRREYAFLGRVSYRPLLCAAGGLPFATATSLFDVVPSQAYPSIDIAHRQMDVSSA
ncbi:hypothetical protein NDU88_006889 [Pleurodeles waltl]|uniref:Uncharacterized protein n=1 Tax=Pleurodeles waltl TaxID=8319 RepID=A0AAV7QN84_PLEWA|nr:hypothetical protein NDU88_006889 [Pleurodeles waltl]